MTSDWKKYKLKDLITIKHGYAFRGNYISVKDNGIVLVTPGNFAISGGFQETKCKFYISDYPEDYILNENDLIVTMTDLSKDGDTLGYSAKIPKTKRIYLHNQRIGLVKIKSAEIDKEFLYWYMRTKKYQQSIVASCSGSVIKHTSPGRICELEILVPDLKIQQKIAKVLSTIDDKIELNNKINENLEQQAEVIFKSWLVDFEPFGGMMPKDWKIARLTDIAEYLNGLAMQKFRPEEGEKNLPVLKIKELRQSYCDTNSDLCSGNINPNYMINDGDVIFSWSGTLLLDFWCGGKCGLNQHLFKVSSEKYDKWFYYYWTKYHLDKFIAIAADKATTMGHIKRQDLERAEVLIPTDKIYDEINNIIKPIIEKIIFNRIENKNLTQLRNTLLPKLMSGEIDTSNINILDNKLLFDKEKQENNG